MAGHAPLGRGSSRLSAMWLVRGGRPERKRAGKGHSCDAALPLLLLEDDGRRMRRVPDVSRCCVVLDLSTT